MNKIPKRFPKHYAAHGWLKRCSDWWAFPGRSEPRVRVSPTAPPPALAPSPALGSLPARFSMGTVCSFSGRGVGGSTLHTKTHESRTPTSALVEGASPLESGIHTRYARRCGWLAKGLHCVPTSEISSHPLSLCLGSRLKLYFTLLRKCGFEVLPPTREAHSRTQLSG